MPHDHHCPDHLISFARVRLAVDYYIDAPMRTWLSKR
jgi:hypothetical protein